MQLLNIRHDILPTRHIPHIQKSCGRKMVQKQEPRASTIQVGSRQAELTREWHWKNDLLSSTTPP